jgi:hypothetical protein
VINPVAHRHRQGVTMRTVKISFLLIAFTFLLTGCGHYLIRGNLNNSMPLEGTMTNYFLEGKSYVQIHTLDKKMWCTGTMIWTHFPNLSTSCDEEEGSLIMDCNNDNRVILSSWTNAGCTQGSGHGWTDHGATFYFDYFRETPKTVCQMKGQRCYPTKSCHR